MFKKFAIKVTSTIKSRTTGETGLDHTAFFESFDFDRDWMKESSVPRTVFATNKEAEAAIEELPVSLCGEYIKKYEYEIEEINYTHANQNGYSDTTPFEIVRVVSDKTIELRSMTAEKNKDWQPVFVSGGFAGHCTNNGDQRNAWVIKSDPEGYTVRARLQKDGSWKSSHGRHSLHTAAIKKYDYNF